MDKAQETKLGGLGKEDVGYMDEWSHQVGMKELERQ